MRKVLTIAGIVLVLATVGILVGTRHATQETVAQLRLRGAAPADTPSTLYLHSRIAGKCAYFYAQHDHETFVTRDSPSGARYSVQQLILSSDIGGEKKSKGCSNASACGRTEKEFNVGCRRSCTHGTATQPGFGTWSSTQVCIW